MGERGEESEGKRREGREEAEGGVRVEEGGREVGEGGWGG